MSNDSKKYDAGDILDIMSIYQNKIELMHYMLGQMRGELDMMKNVFKIHECVLERSYKCIEVLEQLSQDNVTYVHEEMVKYKTEYNKEE